MKLCILPKKFCEYGFETKIAEVITSYIIWTSDLMAILSINPVKNKEEIKWLIL